MAKALGLVGAWEVKASKVETMSPKCGPLANQTLYSYSILYMYPQASLEPLKNTWPILGTSDAQARGSLYGPSNS